MFVTEHRVNLFNSLLDVTEAYRLARLKDLDTFLQNAAMLAKTHAMGPSVGCFILHRHNDLDDSEHMVRSERINQHGQIGVVTRAERRERDDALEPVSFKVEMVDGEFSLSPVEFSSLERDKVAAQALLTNQNFLRAFAQLVYDAEFEEIIGLTVVSAVELENPALTYIEEYAIFNGVRENVVYPAHIGDVLPDSAIPTTWRLSSSDDPDKRKTWDPSKGPKPEYVCFRVCVPYSPGHAIEHRACPNWV